MAAWRLVNILTSVGSAGISLLELFGTWSANIEPAMLKDLTLRRRNIGCGNEACAWKPGVLADDDAGERRKLLLAAILLNRSKEVADAGANKARDARNHVVGKCLAIGGGKS